jgi:hypothetical protein
VKALVVALFLAFAAAASAGTSAQVIDRTFVCTPIATTGGLRDLDVNSSPPYRDATTRVPAEIFLRSGPYSPGEQLVSIRARAQKQFGDNPFRAGVFAHTARCRAASATVPLSATGLPGSPVVWQKEVDCSVRGRVLVRVRAEFESPTAWRPAGAPYAGAVGNVAEAKLAVRSEKTGKPIAFATLSGGTKTKLWTAAGCR